MLLLAEIANGAIAAGQGQHLPVTLWHWVAFCAGTVILLALDMFVFHRDSHEPTLRESAMWTVFWCTLAIVFNLWLWWWAEQSAAAGSAACAVVFDGLPRRMVVVDGQRVRVRGDLCVLRRAAEVSVSRAVLGGARRDCVAADVYPDRESVDQHSLCAAKYSARS